MASALPTDVVVLAENAPQVAPGEENRARTFPAAQAVLFAEVGEMAAHHRVATRLAYSELVSQPVDVAIARAQGAVGERRQRPLYAPGQLSGFVQT